MYNEPIDVWRMSASRPWQLEKTHSNLIKHLKYRGELRYHLIESVLVKDLSNKCIEFAKNNGYEIHVIDPAFGQAAAVYHAIKKVVKSKYSLKWEDDFMPVVDIPLDNCVDVMEKYGHINQICFNKRETMKSKRITNMKTGKIEEWEKSEREFMLDDVRVIPLVVKEKWWFGSSIWRTDFFRRWLIEWNGSPWKVKSGAIHNFINDYVFVPLSVGAEIDINDMSKGRLFYLSNQRYPTQKEVEKHIGCYLYGKWGQERMAEHTGCNDSLWSGELQKRWKKEGRIIQ
jgi:hypothetical protein